MFSQSTLQADRASLQSPRLRRDWESDSAHPVQIQRSLLNDTRGAVYLPMSEHSTVAAPYSSDGYTEPAHHRMQSVSDQDGRSHVSQHTDLNPTYLDKRVYGQSRSRVSIEETKNVKHNGRRIQFASEDNLITLPSNTKRSKHRASRGPSSVKWDPFSPFRNPFRSSPSSSSDDTSVSSTASDYFRPDAFPGHRDTLARIRRKTSDLQRSRSSSGSLSSGRSSPKNDFSRSESQRSDQMQKEVGSNVPKILLDSPIKLSYFEKDLHSRLGGCYEAIASPIPNTTAYIQLPSEVLHAIFSFLSPHEFDAARHTCRDWFFAGMDMATLRTMLQKLGCWQASRLDMSNPSATSRAHLMTASVANNELADHPQVAVGLSNQSDLLTSNEWLMAKRLATEVRLSADWKGSWQNHHKRENVTRLHLMEEIRFRRIFSNTLPKDDRVSSKFFTVSSCGNYVLVCAAHKVFVYRLKDNGMSMAAIVRLVAERNILKVSMDTSSGRFAVAALLDGRAGVLWDLPSNLTRNQNKYLPGESLSLGMQTTVHDSGTETYRSAVSCDPTAQRVEGSPNMLLEPLDVSEEVLVKPLPNVFRKSSSESKVFTQNSLYGCCAPLCYSPESIEDEVFQTTNMPLQIRASAKYKNLGNPNDLPRSVAICPQRKCVAFGCRMGIELHWVDAVTNGDLSRWFPLAAPSDFLYFLPRRKGLDSSKKLRMISSAADHSSSAPSRTGSAPMRWIRRAISHDRGRRQSMTRLFFGDLPFPSIAGGSEDELHRVDDDDDMHGILRTVDCDHYQAIPLSDGIHLIFTDPDTGLLCLGSDAPLGGPTKLVRKVVFVPPPREDCNPNSSMSCYSVGSVLQWGVRVVAAQKDGRLILYNIPSDFFALLQRPQYLPDVWDEQAGVFAQSDLLMDELLNSHPNSSTNPDMGNDASREGVITPSPTSPCLLQIHGSVIGNFGQDTVDDIAVDSSGGGLRVWVFCRSGIARLLGLYMPSSTAVRRRYAGISGHLHERFLMSPSYDRSNFKCKARAHSDEDGDVQSKPYEFYGMDGANDRRLDHEFHSTKVQATEKMPKTDEIQLRVEDDDEKWYLEILTCQLYEREENLFHVETLTDWRGGYLSKPYIVLLV